MSAHLARKSESHFDGLVTEGDEPDVLGSVADPSVDLAIWRRTLPLILSEWLDTRLPHHLPNGRILVGLNDIEAGVASLVRGRTKPARLLAADITGLARMFATIARIDQVDIRLDMIRRDACWRFHRDAVPLRLLVTYRGPGTELPPAEEADRALVEQRDYQGPLRRLPRAAAALFKGDPADSGQGVLHRSPPIAGTGITRLLLCLNPASGASPKRWKP